MDDEQEAPQIDAAAAMQAGGCGLVGLGCMMPLMSFLVFIPIGLIFWFLGKMF